MKELLYYPLAHAVLRVPPPPPPRQRVQFPYQGSLVRFYVQQTARHASDIDLPVLMRHEQIMHLRLYRDGHLDRKSFCEDLVSGTEYTLRDGACICDEVREFGACEHSYADLTARRICQAWIWYEAKRRQRAQREQRYWTMPSTAQEVWL